MSRMQRTKGARAQTAAAHLLRERDYDVTPVTCGVGECDLIAVKEGVTWAVEVKAHKALTLHAWVAQARAQSRSKRWMLLCRLPIHPSFWLVLAQGEEPRLWKAVDGG